MPRCAFLAKKNKKKRKNANNLFKKDSSAALLGRSLVRRYSHSVSALSPSRLVSEPFLSKLLILNVEKF